MPLRRRTRIWILLFLAISHMPSHACLSFLPHLPLLLIWNKKICMKTEDQQIYQNVNYRVLRLWVIFFFSSSVSYKSFTMNIYHFNYQKKYISLIFPLTRWVRESTFSIFLEESLGREMEVDVRILGAHLSSGKTSRCGRIYSGSFCKHWFYSGSFTPWRGSRISQKSVLAEGDETSLRKFSLCLSALASRSQWTITIPHFNIVHHSLKAPFAYYCIWPS